MISTSRVSSGWTLTDEATDHGAPTEEEDILQSSIQKIDDIDSGNTK